MTRASDVRSVATHAVEAHGLVKRFGETEALRGVDLTVERATVLGLLGPNGAGKTTAVRILTTLLSPDAGTAFIDGIDVVKDPRRARARIGLTGQYAAVDERLTGFENLEHVARLFRQPRREARDRARELLEHFDLTAAADRGAGTYSGGMRRRLDIAMSLIGRPSVLFLDEPTTGLDPRSRIAMWDLIDELVGAGMTTLLTTQYLEEADRLAHDIAVIDHGVVIERGSPEELKRRVGGEQLEVVVSRPADAGAARAALAGFSVGEIHVGSDERHVIVPVRDVRGVVPLAVRCLDDARIEVDDVGVRHSTLDDVFFALTGHAAEETLDVADRDGADGADRDRAGGGRADRGEEITTP
ncbi:MAG: daunorubicin resistance protein DrrA family ABC transporter ATP-binding protein [Acidimicrobiia bacterium]